MFLNELVCFQLLSKIEFVNYIFIRMERQGLDLSKVKVGKSELMLWG